MRTGNQRFEGDLPRAEARCDGAGGGAELAEAGFSVIVQSGAGEAASIGDEAYAAAGAKVVPDAAAAWSGADIVFKVRAPSLDEVQLMREGQVLVSFIWPAKNPEPMQAPRREQGDGPRDGQRAAHVARAEDGRLGSMANIAGYRAVIEAAHLFGRFFTGQITAAGKVPPAKCS